MLVAEYCTHESELRADLQQYYGIDFDQAAAGGHSLHHVCCLVEQLPPDARVRAAENPDSRWTLNDVLSASLLNSLNALIYGMSDKRKSKKPEIVGPSWMTKQHKRSMPARVLPVDELMRILQLPRGGE